MKKIYYFFIICFLSCASELQEKKELVIETPQSQFAQISGTSDEKVFNESITFHDDSFFYQGDFKNINKIINNNSVSIQLEKIANPKLLEFNSFGENKYYRTRIIVSPGDSVWFNLKKGKLKFTGKNQEHYNFYLEMDRNYDAWSKLYLDKYNPNFKKYKQQCDSLYNKRIAFFKGYVKKHPTVSDEFKKIIQDDLRFEYLVNIIRPRSEIESKWSVNTSEDIISIYERGNRQEGEFFDLNSYLNNITIQEVNQSEYTNYLYFQMSIVALIRQYFLKSTEIPYSIASFKKESLFLKNNFNQKIIDHTMARLILDYFNKGFGKDDKTAKFMKKVVKKYKESIDDPNIIKVMEDIETELNTMYKALPKDMDELVLNLSKDTVSFSFSLQVQKIKVIDLWASWCQPCLKEIIISQDKRERIANKYDVEFLYLSLDKDTQMWIDKSIDLYDFLPDYKQFKILNQKKSKLIKFLNLKASYGITIPRYIILDRNNKIIDNNAPKPSHKKFEDIIRKLYKNNY